jgi:tetratricopeptide (TPR) repeat protein
MKKQALHLLFLIFILAGMIFINDKSYTSLFTGTEVLEASTYTQSHAPTPGPLPTFKVLENDYHIIQSFNNCGPASLSMALSYYGIEKSQEELGQSLRPYQNPQGDNDDKSVDMEELANQAKKYGLIPYHRMNGDISLLKQFIANGFPILTQTWLHLDEDIGHYRIIKGYDDNLEEVIQDDSYEGRNIHFSYDTFMQLWEKYNYEYLILVPKDKQQLAENILGENVDEQVSWENARKHSANILSKQPNDIYARFNLSVALYHLNDYKGSVREYEKIAGQLPFRTLWYQIEPIQAYYSLGDYTKVFEITDSILNNQNSAFSELYILRGNIYKKQGNQDAAKAEYEKAVYYNENLQQTFNN